VRMLVNLKTFISERGVWVSTVAWDQPIGYDRCSETMVFRGDEKGITDNRILYFESHGYTAEESILKERHERIVESIKKGMIQLGG